MLAHLDLLAKGVFTVENYNYAIYGKISKKKLIFNLVVAFASEEKISAWTEHKNKKKRSKWKRKMTV